MGPEKSNPPLRVELQDIANHLRQVQSAVAVAVGALRSQNADIDADIASLLQRSVSSRLQEQVQRLEALAKRLPVAARRKR